MKNNLVFVHGWCTDSALWNGSIKEIAGEDFAAFSINLPGHGGRRAWSTPTLDPALRELEAITAGLDDESVIGIGWSLGAEVLIAAAARDERFKALVLVGATPRFVSNRDFPHGHPSALVKKMILDMGRDHASVMEKFLELNFTSEELATDEARAFIERYGDPVEGEGTDEAEPSPGTPCPPPPVFKNYELITALEALHDTDLKGYLKDIKIPVLVIHGRSDSVCPIGAGEYLAEEIENAELKVYEKTGHALFVTKRERFNRDVIGFIDSLK